MPREVAMEKVRRYAREIVPSFSAYAYFRVGTRIARAISHMLYRVRIGYRNDEALAAVDPASSVIFVINHRSNMDYVLVTYVAATSSALSYAVGEWAQVWGLQQPDPLDGRLFHRARFPRGALSQGAGALCSHGDRGGRHAGDFPGRRAQPRRQAAPAEIRAAELHGVGLRSARPARRGVRPGRGQLRPRAGRPHADLGGQYRAGQEAGVRLQRGALARHFFRHVWMALRGEWHRFGYTCVSFGEPVSLRNYVEARKSIFACSRRSRAASRSRGSATS